MELVGLVLVAMGAIVLRVAVAQRKGSVLARWDPRRTVVTGVACVAVGVVMLSVPPRDPTAVVTSTALMLWTFLAPPLVAVAWWKRRISRRAAVFGVATVYTLPFLALGSVMGQGEFGTRVVWVGMSVVMFVVTAAGADLVARAFEDDRPRAAPDDLPG